MHATHSGRPPIRSDAKHNKELLINVATEQLSAKGLSVSFDVIARAAGVGVGTVYRHFPTRRELYSVVIHATMHKLTELAESKAASTDPYEGLMSYLSESISCIALNQALCEAMNPRDKAEIISTDVRLKFTQSLNKLWSLTKRNGKVRVDITYDTLIDLMVIGAIGVRRAHSQRERNQIISVIQKGLKV